MPGYELIDANENREVNDVFQNGGGILFRHGFDDLRGDSYKVRDFEISFAREFKVPYALAVSSGTAALRIALAAIGVGPGDEVITQSFTFVATVEAIIESGATPICADIDSTLNLDPIALENLITERTKAVIAVHMLGTPARLEQITKICNSRNIQLIEDTAWGCGGNLKGKPLGTWGSIGTFSFDFAKTITTGEGGMLVFQNQQIYEKAKAWHDHGHENNPDLPRWEDSRSSSGFNFRMMELQAAVGIAQLRKLKTIVSMQRSNRYAIEKVLAQLDTITLREEPDGSYSTSDSLIFFTESSDVALKCRKHLLDIGISTKILPEAMTWHFAREWTHMPELREAHNDRLISSFQQSYNLLTRSVSLPISCKTLPDSTIQSIFSAIKDATAQQQ